MKLLTRYHKTKKDFKYSDNWHKKLSQDHPAKRVVYPKHTASYSREKLAKSVHGVCMSVFGFTGEAEDTALRVCGDVEAWLNNKDEVTAADIKRRTAAALRSYNPRAAYAYAPIRQYRVHEGHYGIVRL